MSKCQNCSNEVQEDAVFCDQCGVRLAKPEAAQPAQPMAVATPVETPTSAPAVAVEPSTGAEAVCPSCGTHNTLGEAFCQDCGAKLAAPAPTAISPAVAPAPVAEAVAANKCPDCGATTGGGEEFCFACGADLKSARQRAASQVQPASQPKAEPAVASAQPVVAKVETTPAVTPAAIQPAVIPAATQAPAAVAACSTCGAKAKEGDTFCEACGASLATTPSDTSTQQPEATVAAAITTPTASAPVTRFIVVASGVEIPLVGRSEIVVGREDPYSGVFPDVDLTPHGGVDGGVSRRHFKITVASGQYRIEDLNSTNYTMVNRKRLQPGTAQPLVDGDEISAGRVKLIFKVTA
jgi:pSer/pThr/pTyr-binding forkhead associated (FHA) protein